MRGATIKLTYREAQDPFQSTLLMRGATQAAQSTTSGRQISIHAPHARSDEDAQLAGIKAYISIHAPHARSDLTSRKTSRAAKRFQSTLLMRGATASRGRRLQKSYFNPRSSCEERRGRAARGPTLVQISIHAPHARSVD